MAVLDRAGAPTTEAVYCGNHFVYAVPVGGGFYVCPRCGRRMRLVAT